MTLGLVLCIHNILVHQDFKPYNLLFMNVGIELLWSYKLHISFYNQEIYNSIIIKLQYLQINKHVVKYICSKLFFSSFFYSFVVKTMLANYRLDFNLYKVQDEYFLKRKTFKMHNLQS